MVGWVADVLLCEVTSTTLWSDYDSDYGRVMYADNVKLESK